MIKTLLSLLAAMMLLVGLVGAQDVPPSECTVCFIQVVYVDQTATAVLVGPDQFMPPVLADPVTGQATKTGELVADGRVWVRVEVIDSEGIVWNDSNGTRFLLSADYADGGQFWVKPIPADLSSGWRVASVESVRSYIADYFSSGSNAEYRWIEAMLLPQNSAAEAFTKLDQLLASPGVLHPSAEISVERPW